MQRESVQYLYIYKYSQSAGLGWSHRKHTHPALAPLISLTPMSHTQLVGPSIFILIDKVMKPIAFPERKLR